jgi:hypothetical protein
MPRSLCLAIAVILAGLASARAAAPDLQTVTEKPAPRHAPVSLVENGVPQATLCVMGVPALREIDFAVRELQTCIEAATGTKLPESRGKIVEGPAIVIGACPEAAAAGLDGQTLPVEGFAIKTTPNRVFIVGHDNERLNAAGTAWGIAEFLERFVDARYYWPPQSGGRCVPKAASLAPQRRLLAHVDRRPCALPLGRALWRIAPGGDAEAEGRLAGFPDALLRQPGDARAPHGGALPRVRQG